jgi:iron complex outermembrane receptor protein
LTDAGKEANNRPGRLESRQRDKMVWLHRCVVAGSQGRRPKAAARRAVACLVSAWALLPAPALAVSPDSLADLSLEELARLEITSVSRHSERLSDAAASVYVITGEAIRRSGARSLPQALRLAPNLQVAQIDANQYAISARGFNNAIGNKLLVLVDGRTVYTPFYSGVFWDQQDLMLADVERIEVISGPGATLWGANAVNGVINVITRAARDTQGTLVSVEGGSKEAQAAARYGGHWGDSGQFRVYAKRVQHQNTETQAGAPASDDWNQRQLGFRTDWSAASDTFTLQGDAYAGKGQARGTGALTFSPIEVGGANLLGRWTRQLDADSALNVQAYYDSSRRDDALLYRPHEDVVDLGFQHSFTAPGQHLLWGGGYRRSREDLEPGFFFGFQPARRTLAWSNVFVQDGIRLDAGLELTLGMKIERNDYTGDELLPSVRLAWKPQSEQLLWGALSRAVRAPAPLDRDIVLPPRPPYLIAGGPGFVSEVAYVAELGWRTQPSDTVSYSATLFQNWWERLRSGQPPPGALVQNMIDGTTSGFEAWGNWQALPDWRLSAGLTLLREHLKVEAGSTDPVGPSALGNDPQEQWTLRSSYDVTPKQELEVAVRHIAALPDPVVPSYIAVDLRYAWRVRPGWTVALVGSNLFGAPHAEFDAAPGRSVIARSLLAQVEWQQ